MKRTSTKRVMASILILLLCAGTACAEETVNVILNAGTTQAFTEDAIPEEAITVILQAGLAATSAINQQPWYFVAVTNQEVMKEIAGSMGGAPASAPAGGEVPAGAPAGVQAPAGMPATASAKAALGDSPLAIIIYMNESTASPNPSFDCGLACQNMVVAATALGYGTKIVSSPTRTLNGDKHDALCETMGVDKSLNAVAVLLVGYANDSTDATSSASTRNTLEDMTSIID